MVRGGGGGHRRSILERLTLRFEAFFELRAELLPPAAAAFLPPAQQRHIQLTAIGFMAHGIDTLHCDTHHSLQPNHRQVDVRTAHTAERRGEARPCLRQGLQLALAPSSHSPLEPGFLPSSTSPPFVGLLCAPCLVSIDSRSGHRKRNHCCGQATVTSGRLGAELAFAKLELGPRERSARLAWRVTRSVDKAAPQTQNMEILEW